ncbi:MAG: phosphoribosylformimino-5-aminoimidazole carboxamide ribotide isomerase [Desulfobulbaceae bacterium]|nr:phosphoribosylformimino-5-aminoimidazole carboxamide ribotide isomerase [Desulfobulbaceae bacterium]
MLFRPCIDLHGGRVKQIVGSTLTDDDPGLLQTNFSSELPPAYYAQLYKNDGLTGGHVIMLGPGNEDAALEALAAYPGGLQVGGGITVDNASFWLDAGASHVIVTSHVFHGGILDRNRLAALIAKVGKKRLVLDLSCRKKNDNYYVVTDRWQKYTDLAITGAVLRDLSSCCAEFLIHAVDVEGKCNGIETDLLTVLAEEFYDFPITYAGGIGSMEDLSLVNALGRGAIDATVGSALDIFGGNGMTYEQVVKFHRSLNHLASE